MKTNSFHIEKSIKEDNVVFKLTWILEEFLEADMLVENWQLNRRQRSRSQTKAK
jgi:hypothetical protein